MEKPTKEKEQRVVLNLSQLQAQKLNQTLHNAGTLANNPEVQKISKRIETTLTKHAKFATLPDQAMQAIGQASQEVIDQDAAESIEGRYP